MQIATGGGKSLVMTDLLADLGDGKRACVTWNWRSGDLLQFHSEFVAFPFKVGNPNKISKRVGCLAPKITFIEDVSFVITCFRLLLSSRICSNSLHFQGDCAKAGSHGTVRTDIGEETPRSSGVPGRHRISGKPVSRGFPVRSQLGLAAGESDP